MNDTGTVLGLTAAELAAGGAALTAREIAQQPSLWPLIAQRVASDAGLAEFVGSLLANPGLRVVLTGAGTSSFIGECLAPPLARLGLRGEAIATTDIVTSPGSTLAPRVPTLMLHFARSGNSPESVAAVELAEQYIENCAHLIVTCNPEGELYHGAAHLKHARCVLLPAECNDQSFAMTSSFTGMLLAAAVALRALGGEPERIGTLARLATHALTGCLPLMHTLVRAQFERAVYLGSNELKGLAREAALKMLELSDGRVVSVGDSPMGFRHGPKTLLNAGTLVLMFLSNQPHTRRYDLDLLAELRRDGVAGRVIALSSRADLPAHTDPVLLGPAAADSAALTDLELCLPYMAFAQALAMLRSMSLGLTPDSPNAAGKVHRVVQGVSIYR